MVQEFHGGNDPFPVGAIQPWVGDPDDVPFGWKYCNGNNGTPDLRNKFVKCVPDAATNPGTTGGQNSFSLTESQLPAHAHSGSTDQVSTHSHYVSVAHENSVRSCGDLRSWGPSSSEDDDVSITTDNGSHSHGTKMTNETGDTSTIDNEPARVTAGFIQKQDLTQ